MKVLKIAQVAVATCVLLVWGASVASAEIVFMTSGGVLSVKGHKTEGESVILTLRSGGEVTCDKSLIEKIVPDEVPHPEPAAVLAAAPQEAAKIPVPERTPLLKDSVYGDLIASAAEAHGVNPILVQALVQVESNYKPHARSPKGAMGLMQIMPATAREYKVRNAYDPKSNIDAGIRKLKSLLEMWQGDVALALAAYNAGAGAVQKYKGIPPYRETQNYVSRILSIAGLR
jgi:soluble lytic murein transglycosylase-like protein